MGIHSRNIPLTKCGPWASPSAPAPIGLFAAIVTFITPVFLDADNGIFRQIPGQFLPFRLHAMALQLIWVLTKVAGKKGYPGGSRKQLVNNRHVHAAVVTLFVAAVLGESFYIVLSIAKK